MTETGYCVTESEREGSRTYDDLRFEDWQSE